MYRLSNDRNLAAMILDVSVAFMHAPTDERIIVKCPKDIPSTTGFWILLKALNGTQRASRFGPNGQQNNLRRAVIHVTNITRPYFTMGIPEVMHNNTAMIISSLGIVIILSSWTRT